MRTLLLLALLVVVVVIISRARAAWRSPRAKARERARDELVKDPVCQTYVVMSRAIRAEADGAPLFFCSRECAARFRHGERRA